MLRQRDRKQVQNYHDTSYYRANPYSKLNYMPPCSQYNRKPKQFAVQMPQGDDAFFPIKRKIFPAASVKSQINDFQLLPGVQTPYYKIMTMPNDYPRNLHTQDIEGATSSSKTNQSLVNKLRAQQYMMMKGKSISLTPDNQEMQSSSLIHNITQTKQIGSFDVQSNQKNAKLRDNKQLIKKQQNIYYEKQKNKDNNEYEDYLLAVKNEKDKRDAYQQIKIQPKPISRKSNSLVDLHKKQQISDSLDNQLIRNKESKKHSMPIINEYLFKKQLIGIKRNSSLQNNLWQGDISKTKQIRSLNPTNLSYQYPFSLINAAKNTLIK